MSKEFAPAMSLLLPESQGQRERITPTSNVPADFFGALNYADRMCVTGIIPTPAENRRMAGLLFKRVFLSPDQAEYVLTYSIAAASPNLVKAAQAETAPFHRAYEQALWWEDADGLAKQQKVLDSVLPIELTALETFDTAQRNLAQLETDLTTPRHFGRSAKASSEDLAQLRTFVETYFEDPENIAYMTYLATKQN